MEKELMRSKKQGYKREGAAGWVCICKKVEPRFDYPVPCIRDIIEVREVTWLSSLNEKMEYSVGTCYVYGMTNELVICRKFCSNGVSYDISFRKKEFLRGGIVFSLANDDKKEMILKAVSS